MAFDPSLLGKTNADINEQLMNAQQQLALAQALRGQSLQPLQPAGGQNAVISPLSALAQALNGYTANKKMGAATHDFAQAQAAQAQNQIGAMGAIVNQLKGQIGGAAPQAPQPSPAPDDGAPLSSVPQASLPNFPAAPNAASQPASVRSSPQPAAGASVTPPASPDLVGAGLTGEMFGFPAFSKYAFDQASLTPEQKNSRDPLIGSSVRGNLDTQNMTELQRLQRARALLPPGSPQIAEIDSQIKKLNYVAPKDVAPGVLTLDSDNKPLAYNPPAIKGAVPQFQTKNGFTTAPGVVPQAGAVAVNANMEGAEQGAKEANSIKTVTQADGSSRTDWGGRVAGTTGPSTTDQAVQKSSADTIAEAPKVIQQSRSAITGLEAAERALRNVKATGPGTAKTNEIVSIVNNAFGTNIDAKSADAYQQVAKYLNNSLNAAAQGTGASGSDARFDSFMHGQPNGDNMNIGPLQGAIRYVLSQHDANAARGQFLQDAYAKAKAAGDPNAAMTAQAQWSQVYKPDFFAFNRMTPEEHVEYLKSLGPKADDFVKQYNDYADKTKWVH